MGLWIEENLPALFVGAGIGSGIAHLVFPEAFSWLFGALAGIGLALPVWQMINHRRG